jgi:hypothetical protein
MSARILQQSNQVPLLHEYVAWLHKRRIQFYVSSVVEPDEGYIYHASIQEDLPEVESSTFDSVIQRLVILIYLGMMTGRIHDSSAVMDSVWIELDASAVEAIRKAQSPIEPPPASDARSVLDSIFREGADRPDSSVQP